MAYGRRQEYGPRADVRRLRPARPGGRRDRGPAGIALHHHVLSPIAAAAGTPLPASFVNVYGSLDVTGLALAGLLMAVAGALLPVSWAARISTASALRTE